MFQTGLRVGASTPDTNPPLPASNPSATAEGCSATVEPGITSATRLAAVPVLARQLQQLQSSAEQLITTASGLQPLEQLLLHHEAARAHQAAQAWQQALQQLQCSLIQQPGLLQSQHLGHVIQRCLEAAHPPCARLLLQLLRHSQHPPAGGWDAKHIHLAEDILGLTADYLAAFESWSLLKQPQAPHLHSLELAGDLLRHPLTTAQQVSANSWLPTRPLRAWLLLLCLRLSGAWHLPPAALRRLLAVLPSVQQDHNLWQTRWRDPETILLWLAPPRNNFHFGAASALPLDGCIRWVLPWRAIFATLHQSGNGQHISHLLSQWQVHHD